MLRWTHREWKPDFSTSKLCLFGLIWSFAVLCFWHLFLFSKWCYFFMKCIVIPLTCEPICKSNINSFTKNPNSLSQDVTNNTETCKWPSHFHGSNCPTVSGPQNVGGPQNVRLSKNQYTVLLCSTFKCELYHNCY